MTFDMPALDLLVVGGLTIDRFPDGSSAPGGSVLHIARAAATRALRIGVATAVGPEPEAQAGLQELRRLTALIESSRGAATATFRHLEEPAGRRLWLERRGGAVELGADADDRIETQAILYGPIAEEVPPDALTGWESGPQRGAILQGWLRTTDQHDEVQPRPLSALSDALVEALGGFDLLVASREDLLAEARDPSHQLRSMRRVFGPGPTLVVTDGVDGVWVDAGQSAAASEPWHLPVPWRVEEVPTVGSGDIFAAFMLPMPDGDYSADRLTRQAEAAMRVVAEVLEERAPSRG